MNLCRILLYGLLLLLCACGPRRYPSSLVAADSLASVCPDSALALLAALEPDTARMPLAHRMYYRLLCVKAADKAYLPHTSDSLIRPLIHYYIEEESDLRLLPEACYYAGRVYRDLGNDLQALDYFEEALHAIRQNGDRASVLQSKVYSQMGTLYAYRDMFGQALQMYKEGLRIDRMLSDSVSLVFALRDIAYIHLELNHPDSVLPYFKHAKRIADLLGRRDLSDMVQSQLAAVYTERGQYDSARVALKDALRNNERPNLSSIYFIAGNFYQAIGKQDSANYYYRQLLRMGTVYAQERAYRALTAQRVSANDDSSFIALYDGLLQNFDSLRALDRKANLLRAYADYNYLQSEQENDRLKARNERNRFILVVSGAVILILFSLLMALTQRNRRIRQEAEEQRRKFRQVEEEQRKKRETLENYRRQKEELEKISPDDRQIRKLELINHVLEQDRLETEEEREAQDALFRSPLYRELERRVRSARGTAFVTDDEWDTLRRLLIPAYPKFFERLNALCTLNENELHVSILLKVGFRPADIARLLNLQPTSVSSIRARLYKKATGGKGTADLWDKMIHSL